MLTGEDLQMSRSILLRLLDVQVGGTTPL